MFGVPCGICMQPLLLMDVHSDHFVLWHVALPSHSPAERCVVPIVKPPRRRKGLLHPCPACKTLHTLEGPLCRSCRNQGELFTREQLDTAKEAAKSKDVL